MFNLGEIKVAIAGVGNCASSLIQGLYYYQKEGNSLGLLHDELAGYKIGDIKIVAAFDIDENKIGKDVAEAIFASPNKAPKVVEVKNTGVKVQMGPAPDTFGELTMSEIKKANEEPVDICKTLKESGAQILLKV